MVLEDQFLKKNLIAIIGGKWWRREGANCYWAYWSKKVHPENDENSIDFRLSDAQKEDDIVKTNFTKNWLKQTYEEIKKTEGLFDDHGIVPKENKN